MIERNRDTGSAAYRVKHPKTIGRETTCKATSAEIHAIETAIEYARKEKRAAWVMSASQEVLRRISGGGRSKLSRDVVSSILRELQLTRERDIEIKLLWIPGHKGIAGNERAHRAAQDTTAAHQYTYSFDCAAPGKHDPVVRCTVARRILAQARTSHSHLPEYLARTWQIASAACECREGVETVQHVILWCPMWSCERQ